MRWSGVWLAVLTVAVGTGTAQAVPLQNGKGFNARELDLVAQVEIASVGGRVHAVTVGNFFSSPASEHELVDMAIGYENGTEISILIGDRGDVTPNLGEAVGSGPHTPVSGDFDGDGDIDLAVANGGTNDVTILNRDAGNSFVASSTLTIPGGDATDIAVGQLNANQDTDLDLAVASQTDDTVRVFLGAAGLTFTTGPSIAINPGGASDNPKRIAVADVNQANGDDIVTANIDSSDSGVSIALSNGNATFAPTSTIDLGFTPEDLVVASLDGGGDPDLLVIDSLVSSVALLGGAGATFTTAGDLGRGTGAAVADLDGDGDQDAVVARPLREAGNSQDLLPALVVATNDGTGTLTRTASYPLPADATTSGIGLVDWPTVSESPEMSVFVGDPSAQNPEPLRQFDRNDTSANVISRNLGTVEVGRTGTAQAVSYTLDRGGLVSPSPAIAGADAADFVVVADGCGSGAPLDRLDSTSCNVSVRCAPTAAGARAASLVFRDIPRFTGPVAVDLTCTGVAATAGPAGPAGSDGQDGVPGPAGPTGAAGAAGQNGAAGPAGPTGAAGAAGQNGPVGPAGPAGPGGVAGPKGDPGPSGPAAVVTCAVKKPKKPKAIRKKIKVSCTVTATTATRARLMHRGQIVARRALHAGRQTVVFRVSGAGVGAFRLRLR